MHEAQFYTNSGDTDIKCLLCPHECIIKEETYGRCNVRMNIAGKLYSENYGKVTGLNFDPVEKKPFYNFFPGKMIQSVGTYGCNLACSFCQNYHMSQAEIHNIVTSKYYNPSEIVEATLANKNCCGISYTYNEPVVWYEFMMDIAEMAKEKDLVNTVVSNGYINPKPLDKMLNVIDGFNIDLKGFSKDFYIKLTKATFYPVKETLKKIAKSNAHLEITNLIIPGLNDDPVIFGEMTDWIASELGKNTPLHINRYFPCYKLNIEQTKIETLVELKKIASKKLNFVYCGNISAIYGESNTICPKCKKTVIKRLGYEIYIDQIDKKGHCVQCKYKIAVC